MHTQPAWKSGLRLGILGGGQLARMLFEAAHALGTRPTIYSHALDDQTKLHAFLSNIDICLFENEFVNGERLQSKPSGPLFFPSIRALETLRDKANQKRLLDRAGVPSAKYFVHETGDPMEWVRAKLALMGGEGVLKWSRLGYDGKGVMTVSHDRLSEATPFIEGGLKVGAALLLEERIRFTRELAIIGCRSQDEFRTYPVVVSEQRENICVLVTGPASSLGLSAEREAEAQRYARAVAESADLFGVFAIELFETERGLLVNEIAPRVHNSGHYTQDASHTSQFENHVRAALGLPLGDTATCAAFAMRNLLGPSGLTRAAVGAPLPAPAAGEHLHWYDKAEIRPGRKLGHINAVGTSAAQISELASRLESRHRDWEAKLRGG